MKKEYMLSFENEEKKNQSELSFEYRAYNFLNEYLFSYKRDGISLNMKRFNDLVPLLKMATRSFFVPKNLFVRNEKPIEFDKQNITVKMNKPIIMFAQNNFVHKNKTFKRLDKMFVINHLFNRYNTSDFKINFVRQKDDIYVNYIDNLSLKIIGDEYLNVYSYIFLNQYYYLNKYENINLYDNDIQKNINDLDIEFARRDNFLFINGSDMIKVINKDINVCTDNFLSNNNKNINIYDYSFLYRDISSIYLFSIDSLYKYKDKLNIYDIDFTRDKNKNLNIFENNLIYKSTSIFKLNVFENVFSKTNSVLLSIIENDILNKTNKQLFLNTLDLASYSNNNKKVSLYENVFGKTFLSSSNLLIANHIDIFSKIQYGMFINDTDFSERNKFKVSIFNIIDNFSKLDEPVSLLDTLSFSLKNNYELYVYNNIDSSKKYDKSLYIYDQQSFAYKNKAHMSITSLIDFANKNQQFASLFNKIEAENKYLHNITLYNSLQSTYKKSYYMYSFYEIISANKNSVNLYLDNTNTFLNSDGKSIVLLHSLYSVLKEQYDVNKVNNIAWIEKSSKDINRYMNQVFIEKLKYCISLKNINTFIYKNKKSLSKTIYQEFLFKQPYDSNLYYKDTIGFFKEYKNFNFDKENSYDIMKELIPICLFTDDDKAIISINKMKKDTFTEDTLQMMLKAPSKSFYTTNLTATKLSKNFFELDNLLCDKLALNTRFTSLINQSISKIIIQTWFYNNDIFINKNRLDTFESKLIDINKYATNTYIYNVIDIDKTKHSLFDTRYLFIDRNNRNTTIYEQELKYNKYYYAYAFNEYWLNNFKFGFMSNNETVFRKIYNATSKDGLFGEVPKFGDYLANDIQMSIQKKIITNKTIELLRTSTFNANFYEHYFLSKNIVLNELPEFSEMHKLVKDAIISTDEIIDWAWVYEEDEPFDDPFKIDELLLPQNDTRYEDFEDIIFNRETKKPRNPVQIFEDDENKFIAKFPNHYPIKDNNGKNAYENIAVEYLDVRTSIMRKVFLGYYKIWQDNIFDFSRMTIPQSAKKMLDYLYTWIILNFPEEDIPEAFRTFRLVRWYLERSIIECSEYIVTYHPDDLTSGTLSDTNFQIPSDIFEEQKMYIDTQRHIIRNNPKRLNEETHLTLEIENTKNTTISFSLHTTNSACIRLNNDIIDTITLPFTGKLVYNIPYTGDVNYFTIQREAFYNTDDDFFIGNIVIAGMGSTGKLDIEFNPKIQGNKVLNHVSHKVFSYINLYDDNEQLMQALLKGNIHIDEVYDKLLEYWDIHHQNKDKGKRLTIKRT